MGVRLIVTVAALACFATAVPIAEASFPGRNGLIAFEHLGPQSEVTIRVVDPRSGRTREITHVSRRCASRKWAWVDYQPSFSASGRLLVYSHFDLCDSHRPDGIYAVRSDGTGRRLILRSRDGPLSPALGPTGRSLAFTDDVQTMMLMSWRRPARPHELPLPSRYRSARGPAWGVNGRLAFAAVDLGKGFDGHIMTVAANGKRLHLVTRSTRDSAPDWSPTADRIVFRREAVGFDADLLPVPSKQGPKRGRYQGDVFVTPARTQGRRRPRRLTHTRDAWGPVWSPDGRYIAYVRAPDVDGGNIGSLWVMRAADGGGQRLLAVGWECCDDRISWQPRPRR